MPPRQVEPPVVVMLAGVVAALMDRTGGSAFYTTELAGRLPEDTQSLLMVAAVAGRDLGPDLLERLTGIDT